MTTPEKPPRTVRQYGIAFGSSTANITAKINNVIVYQGPVTTLDEPFPTLPNLDYTVTNVLFSWEEDLCFAGHSVVEIQNDNNSEILVAEIAANYTGVLNPAFVDANTTPGVPKVISSGPNNYASLKTSEVGNVYINGVLQTINRQLDGQYWWQLSSAGNIIIDTNIDTGIQ